MAKYHLTADGPARCTARIRSCPLGGEHFERVEEADRAYHAQMSAARDVMAGQRKRALEASPTYVSWEDAATKVARAIEHAEGEWLDLYGSELQPGDVFANGVVVDDVDPSNGENDEYYGTELQDVWFKGANSTYPEGFSYHHYPSLHEGHSPISASSSQRIFRPRASH